MSEFSKDDKVSTVVGTAPGSSEDLSWLNSFVESALNKTPSKIEINALNNAGGLTGDMKVVSVTFEDDSSKTYVWKSLGESRLGMSKQVGLAREAFFYHYLASTLSKAGVSLAEVIYTYGNMETGEKSIILENLSTNSIQSGLLFGPGSPLNWGKDIDSLISASNTSGQEWSLKDVASKAFTMAAKMHATYWHDTSLLQYEWLRGNLWYQQKGEEEFNASQALSTSYWAKAKAKIAAGETSINWSPHVIACMDASIAKADWTVYQQDIAGRQWTLVHGDYHPANMMWRWGVDGKQAEPVILDWEVVGLGSGPQDLAQYLISHASPADRRAHEETLVKEYYSVLTTAAEGDDRKTVDASQYTYEQCWKDYVSGGTERWVWLFAYLTGLCPDNMNQYFHDQLGAFMEDHGVTPENIGMPRV